MPFHAIVYSPSVALHAMLVLQRKFGFCDNFELWLSKIVILFSAEI
jgi:hypothetical protein